MTSVTRWGPSASQCSTSGTKRVRLHLNAFRGEPAISRFDWHFTATHSSSEPSSTDTGSVLQPETIRPSTWPWVDHLVSGPLSLTCPDRSRSGALFGLGFPTAPALHQHVNLPVNVTRRFILQKARRRTGRTHGASTAWGRRVSGSVSLRSRGTFHLSLTVLVRYRWPGVVSLGGWSPRIPPGFLVSRGTWVATPSRPAVPYRPVTVSRAAFQQTSGSRAVSYSVNELPLALAAPTTPFQQRRQA